MIDGALEGTMIGTLPSPRRGRRGRFCAAIVALIAFAIGSVRPAPALSLRRLGLEDLVRHADRIVVAHCAATRDLPARVAGIGVTETRFVVRAWIKRNRNAVAPAGPEPDLAAPAELVLRHLRLEDLAGGGPAIARGDEVVLFLHGDAASGLASPVGMHQGIFKIVRADGGMGAAVVMWGDDGAVPSSGTSRIGAGGRDEGPALPGDGSGGPRSMPLETFIREVTRLVGDGSQ
jgi:hypothetical protein